MQNFKNKNWFSDDLLKPDKNNNYYYDFGTGNKIERADVKEKRDALLGVLSKPTNQKKDDFLEGFNDPYGEKQEQERKERFAKVRENADKRVWSSRSATDSFLDGFNFGGIVKKREKENGVFQKKEPEYTHFPLASSEKPKAQNFPNYSTTIPTPVKYEDAKPKNSWYSYLGGDLVSDRDKETFIDGLVGKNEISQKQSPDEIEFGHDPEVIKILKDLGTRWYDATPEEQARLHGVAEEVRRLARGNNRVKYGTDEIFDVMHKNAKTGQLVKGLSLGTIPMQSVLTNPLLAGVLGSLLEPGAFLTAMALDKNQWNYKYQDKWHPKETYTDKNDGSRRYDGKNLDLDDQKNYIPWIYFDGYLIGADKFGNMNMAYVGKKMDLPEWVYKNFETMDDPEDIFWIDKGTELAESGR